MALHPLNNLGLCSQEIKAFLGPGLHEWLRQHLHRAADKEEKKGGKVLGCVWGGENGFEPI